MTWTLALALCFLSGLCLRFLFSLGKFLYEFLLGLFRPLGVVPVAHYSDPIGVSSFVEIYDLHFLFFICRHWLFSLDPSQLETHGPPAERRASTLPGGAQRNRRSVGGACWR